jgi:hypothetical protein
VHTFLICCNSQQCCDPVRLNRCSTNCLKFTVCKSDEHDNENHGEAGLKTDVTCVKFIVCKSDEYDNDNYSEAGMNTDVTTVKSSLLKVEWMAGRNAVYERKWLLGYILLKTPQTHELASITYSTDNKTCWIRQG